MMSLALALGNVAACNNTSAIDERAIAQTIGYPRAAWRLLPYDELNRTVFWVSHVLIRHNDSQPGATLLRPPGWEPDPPAPKRSAEAALSLTMDLQAALVKRPDEFDAVARKYSEDAVTRPLGGSLGGVRAGQLPPEFLDALSVLKPGQISRVIRTSFGFHILKRRAIPKDEKVAGRRIVVRYEGTVGGPSGHTVERTRDAAKRLAEHIAHVGQAEPENFLSLISRYSENEDVEQGGDIGVWSTRDPEFRPREIERLASLRVGEVSDPIDSVFGFEILQRQQPEPRKRYAMAAIQIAFDERAPPGAPESVHDALQQARQLAQEVKHTPENFDLLRRSICCEHFTQWTSGRGPIGLSAVLEDLKFNEISDTPVPTGGAFVIAKRLDPTRVPAAEAPRYELRVPEGPNFDTIVRLSNGPGLAAEARRLSDDAVHALKLEEAQEPKFRKVMEELAKTFESKSATPESRVAAWHTALQDLHEIVGASRVAEFDRFLNAWAMRRILDLSI